MATLICMKKTLLLPLLLLSLVVSLNSCLKGEAHYTPQVNLRGFLTTTGDTLHLKLSRENDYFYLDTISVGDTVKCYVTFEALGNNLLRTEVLHDTTNISLYTDFSGIKQVIDSTRSDMSKFSIAYKPNAEPVVTGISMLIRMVPLRNGESKLQFRIESDSKYSPTERTLVVRVADKKKPE